PIGALANPLVTWAPRAIAAGATLINDAMVTRVEATASARALHWRDASGEPHVQPADLLILAGAPVQNARLLLASADGGLGNRSGMLGRGFATHLLVNGHALFEEETQCHLGVSAGGLASFSDYPKRRASGAPGSIAWGIAPATKPNDLLGIANTRPDLIGAALHAFVARASRHLATINAIVETIPQPDNRIALAASRDAYGMPLARIHHRAPAEAAALVDFARARAAAVLRAAGAAESWVPPLVGHAHLSGGTVMGSDPATSVADSFGRLHDVPGVMVMGAGLMPSIGAVSPTFTLLALADRAAEAVLQGNKPTRQPPAS
ncbi:MAG: GMC oxidoreductase, partial [Thermaurantiacus sp.]